MEDFNGCPYSNIVALNDTLTILSGKWKLNIIRALLFRKYRFNELQMSKYQSLVIFLKKKTNFLVYLHFVSYVCIKIENKDKNDTESKI